MKDYEQTENAAFEGQLGGVFRGEVDPSSLYATKPRAHPNTLQGGAVGLRDHPFPAGTVRPPEPAPNLDVHREVAYKLADRLEAIRMRLIELEDRVLGEVAPMVADSQAKEGPLNGSLNHLGRALAISHRTVGEVEARLVRLSEALGL